MASGLHLQAQAEVRRIDPVVPYLGLKVYVFEQLAPAALAACAPVLIVVVINLYEARQRPGRREGFFQRHRAVDARIGYLLWLRERNRDALTGQQRICRHRRRINRQIIVVLIQRIG